MRITSFLNSLKGLSPTQRFFLFFGNHEELIFLRQRFLKKCLEKIHGQNFMVRDIDQIDTVVQPKTLSLFSKTTTSMTLYRYSSGSMKTFEQFQMMIPQIESFLIWQAGSIATKSPLIQSAEKHPLVWLIPTYQPERGEIENYIQIFFEEESITLDPQALQFLVGFHQNALSALQSNLDILALYALKSKELSRDDVQNVCQSFESEDLKACATAFLQADKKTFLEQFRVLGSPSTMLIPFLRFAGKMLQNTFDGSGYTQNPAAKRSKDNIVQTIKGFYQLEQQLKTEGKMPDVFIERALLKLCRL